MQDFILYPQIKIVLINQKKHQVKNVCASQHHGNESNEVVKHDMWHLIH